LPWRDNKPKRSCIPEGTYHVRMRNSPRFGRVYEITGVPGRSDILIHAGNFAGDVDAGLQTHVQGCVLVGQSRGILGGQRAVMLSRPALRAFLAHMRGEPFSLGVVWKS
jgi:hypothetical protein